MDIDTAVKRWFSDNLNMALSLDDHDPDTDDLELDDDDDYEDDDYEDDDYEDDDD